jgi:hypothetical protein
VTALLRQLVECTAPPDAEPLPSGLVVSDRFELVREIGRGGFGMVYEAWDRKLRRPVAFKVVQLRGKLDLREESLLREAEAAAQLNHPNIVTLHDLGQFERGPYLVLELLRGQTLARRLADGAIPLPEALRIAADVAKGLRHAHSRGVIHRDLAPGNVLLCDDGQVKVLDFGLAHGFGRRKVEGGTRPYMAPEQYRGAPEDERTDVFALGAVLFQMLSGRLAFPRGAHREATEAPRLEVPGLPSAEAVVARMLRKDPVERPRDGGEVADALVALLEKVGRAPVASGPVRVRGRTRRRLPALAAAAALLVGLAVAWRWREPERSPAPARVPAREEARPAAAPPAAPAPLPERAGPAEPPAAPVARPRAPRRAPDRRPGIVSCQNAVDAVPTPPAESGEGVLTMEAEPFGDVFVEGRLLGETPYECRVGAGTWVVRVVHPRLGAREARVTVEPGRRARWMANLLGAGPAKAAAVPAAVEPPQGHMGQQVK